MSSFREVGGDFGIRSRRVDGLIYESKRSGADRITAG